MPSMRKIKLTKLMVQRGLCADEDSAKRYILAGELRASGNILLQPSMLVDPNDNSLILELQTGAAYASRGGNKLAGALVDLCFSPRGMKCMDVGASSGGFTDCLLQSGAQSVLSVDVAYGQFNYRLRSDARVTVLERQNIRKLDPSATDAPFELIVADLSFTPLSSMFKVLSGFQDPNGKLLVLIKPQFELDAKDVEKGGIVCEHSLHEQAISRVLDAALLSAYYPKAMCFSRLKGPKGNIEFFLLAQRTSTAAIIDIEQLVSSAHAALLGKTRDTQW